MTTTIIDNVANLGSTVQYVAAAGQTVLPYPFPIFANTDLTIFATTTAAPSIVTTLVLGTDYNVSGAGNDTGGNVTLTVPATVGTLYTVQRTITIQRTTNYQQNGPFTSAAINSELDHIVLIEQQLNDMIGRCIRIPATSAALSANLQLNPANFAGSYLTMDANGNILPAVLSATAVTLPVIAGLLNPTTPAETAAGVTPTSKQYIEGDVRRYGADATGATFSDAAFATATAVARQMAQPTIYVPGQFKLVSWNLSNMVSGVASPAFNSKGLRIVGTGVQSSKVTIIAGTANTGIGIDAAGMAYWHWSDVCFFFGTSTANAPQVGLLLGKTAAGGSTFAGIGKFECCQFISYGSYGVFDQGAEDIDFNNCLGINPGTGTPYCFSRANTAGIASPNTTLLSPADSMTTISFSGAESVVQASGPQCIFLDIGSTTGVGTFDFGSTYVNLSGPTTAFLRDNGGAGSVITGLHSAMIQTEFNGAAGTNQVMVISAQYPSNFHLKGSSAYTNPATQISPLFVFGNPLLDSHISWTGNTVPGYSQPSTLISGSQAFGCIFQTTGAASSVVFSGGGQLMVLASDFIQSSMGATTFSQPITANPGSADGTVYTLATLKGGARTSNSTDGGIRRLTKANIGASTTAIYTGMSFGELVTVTGVGGAGAIFADLLMCSYNSVTVISSNAQQGSPVARTYTVSTGTLSLAMASGSYNVIVQSLVTGAQA